MVGHKTSICSGLPAALERRSKILVSDVPCGKDGVPIGVLRPASPPPLLLPCTVPLGPLLGLSPAARFHNAFTPFGTTKTDFDGNTWGEEISSLSIHCKGGQGQTVWGPTDWESTSFPGQVDVLGPPVSMHPAPCNMIRIQKRIHIRMQIQI